jgi:transcriptional regulator with PAS, ATPase and Fis domain
MSDYSQSLIIDYLISQNVELICICDEDGTVIKANKTVIDTSEKTEAEIIGSAVKKLFSEKNQ